MTATTATLVFLSVSLNATAQIFLKRAVMALGSATAAGWLTGLAASPPFWSGVVCFGASFLTWLLVLARLPVSVAYPLASLGYVVASVLGVLLLNEAFSLSRVVGLVLICSGVFMLSRTA